MNHTAPHSIGRIASSARPSHAPLRTRAAAFAATCALTLSCTIATPAWADENASSSAQSLSPALSQVLADALGNATSNAAAHFIDSAVLTPDAFTAIGAAADAPATFALDPGTDAPALSAEAQEEISEALGELNGNEAGFFFIDLTSGNGIAYNLDERVYGASSFKGPYAAYLCETRGDGEAGLSDSTRSLIESMVVSSDNNAFKTLRNTYDSAGFSDWLSSCAVDAGLKDDTHFPRYSARESALLWLHTYRYLRTDTDTAQWLKGLYAQTNVSMIRSGIADEGATVYNKAGWSASGTRFSGLCDAGLIECDGKTYLMSIMSGAPDSGSNQAALSDIAEALFAQRDTL